MKLKRLIISIALPLCILCSISIYGQFGATLTDETLEEVLKRQEEERRIIKHNEYVLSERARLNNGKQTGIIILIIGAVILCAGGIIQVVNTNKKALYNR